MYKIIYDFLKNNDLKDDIQAINYYKSLGYDEKLSIVLGLVNYDSFMFKHMKTTYELTPENFCDLILEDIKKKIEENEDAKSFDDIYQNPLFHFTALSSSMVYKSASVMSRGISALNCSVPAKGMSMHTPSVALNGLSFDSSNAEYEDDEDYCEEELFEASSDEGYMASVNKLDLETRTDKYNPIEEKGFLKVLNNPTSTFRTTNNTASMGIIKNNFKKFKKVDKSMVRIEELLNYYRYKLKKPEDGLFEINTDIHTKENGNKILFVGVQASDKIPTKQNVVLLLDVSGSMSGHQRQMQASFFTVLSKLSDTDKFSLITYSNNDTTIFKTVSKNKTSILEIAYKFLQIEINGCTYGSKGLSAAYDLIEKNKINYGINRIFILTDGDFNFGLIKNDSIEEFILKKKETGAYLSIIGTGTYNINDHLMETLAKNGNGNYVQVNCLDDVIESVNENYASLAYTVAIDVKAQVEFNPKYVESYRLIGYENRKLNHEDFKNDRVISEPFGSGAVAIAVYEIIPNKDGVLESDLKYQKAVSTDLEDICTVKVRYKDLNKTESVEVSKEVVENETNENAKFAYLIAMSGEKLRKSEYYERTTLEKEFLEDAVLKEFIELNDTKIELLKEFLK